MSTKRNLHGVVLLDKPAGVSSNHALQRVKRLLGARKAGHTGSLDPLATGLLPICLGQATKVSEYLLHSDKRYFTTIKLGETTDTLDSEGQILAVTPVTFQDAELEQVLATFRGEIEQIPPMYSALKKEGQPLYKLARKGEHIERKPRKMTVHSLTAKRVAPDFLQLDVQCSSGFYIRSLADDLGQALGCGAHVVQLRRNAIKNISIDQAITLAELESMDNPHAVIQPLDCLISDLPNIHLSSEQLRELEFGRRPLANDLNTSPLGRFIRPDGTLFGVGEVTPNGLLRTHKMFVLNE